jgi:hypothetical protein
MGVSILSTGLDRPTGLSLKKEGIYRTFKTFTPFNFWYEIKFGKKIAFYVTV